MNETATDILTVEEAAKLLRIPRSSVYKLAQEGKIPGQKVGKHWRFHRDTLVQWVARGALSGMTFDAREKSSKEGLDFS